MNGKKQPIQTPPTPRVMNMIKRTTPRTDREGWFYQGRDDERYFGNIGCILIHTDHGAYMKLISKDITDGQLKVSSRSQQPAASSQMCSAACSRSSIYHVRSGVKAHNAPVTSRQPNAPL